MDLFRARLSIAMILSLSLAACAGAQNKPTEPGARDTTGSYDSRWVATILKPPSTQGLGGNWRQTCRWEPFDWSFSVEDGRASISIDDIVYETPVASDGRFVFLIPTNRETEAAAGSVSTLGDGSITLILRGNLGKKKGSYTQGVAQFANDGCTTKVRYTRSSGPVE